MIIDAHAHLGPAFATRTLPGLTKEDEAKIMGGNMARILGIS